MKRRGSTEQRSSILSALQSAFRDGEISAAFVLGRLYDEGWGVARSASVAAKWYLKAAEGGVSNAFYFVGYAFLSGEGVRKNARLGLRWFQRAAAGGDLTAEYMAAVCVADGTGTKMNPTKGLRLLRKAADRGSGDAMDFLAAHYLKRGQLLVARDWARRAIRAGDPVAHLRLKEIQSLLKPGQASRKSRKLANQSLQADEHLGRFAPSLARR
jgi:TPR repeat protein